ncbi:MAG: class I SAM-dependent methyltransferase [Rhodothermales bacterium]|nr:class I SAM-dependent methyltransferase [Rhodothermales bacterium]
MSEGFDATRRRDFERLLQRNAFRHGVLSDIHSLDSSFQFLFDNPSFVTKEDAVRFYFDDGARSAYKIAELVGTECRMGSRRYRLLECPSGYGGVTRHLVRSLGAASVTCSDPSRRAVEFVQETFGVQGFTLPRAPLDLSAERQFDVVVSLSFFTYLPERTWEGWLQTLLDVVVDGGCLIFTTHGLKSLDLIGIAGLDDRGFWSQQSEDSSHGIGPVQQTVVHPRYVVSSLRRIDSIELVMFREGGWWGHQDLWVVRKVES